MKSINFTTFKGTEYILSFDQLDIPENIEVSFQTKEKGFETTPSGASIKWGNGLIEINNNNKSVISFDLESNKFN